MNMKDLNKWKKNTTTWLVANTNSMLLISIIAVFGSVSVSLGLYIGIWFCFVGGIMQIVEGVTADPVGAMDIAVGVLRFVSSSISGTVTFLMIAFFGAIVFAVVDE